MTTESTAADLSQVFDTVKQRVESYNSEKKQLADSLRQIISSAQELLGSLGESASVRRRGPRKTAVVATRTTRKRGSPRKTAGKRGRPKGMKLSAAARKRISEAQKA